MQKRIRIHVEELFENAPDTRKTNELKAELTSNLIEKYEDLYHSGMSDEEAFKATISGIGNIDELINMHQNENKDEEAYRKKNALAVSVSVGLYILSVAVFVFLEEVAGVPESIVVPIFFLMIAAATCLLIYNYMSRPKYLSKDDTLVEEFKEWKQEKERQNDLQKSISSIFWTLTVGIYLFISFHFQNWHISWIIFLIAAAVDQIIRLALNSRK